MNQDINGCLHILTAKQFERNFLEYLFRLTDQIRKIAKSKEGMLFLSNLLPHKRVMLYFTQPSTRTFLSFQTSCHILGMKTSEIRDPTTSSEQKGESLEDSLRTFSSYVDLIIMRSPVAGLCDRIARLLNETYRPISVINAGSGPDEHPTQAILDLYTLHRGFEEKGGIKGKKICIIGDLKRGRTVRSLSKMLSLYEDVTIYFVSDPSLQIKEDLRESLLKRKNLDFFETDNLLKALPHADAIYMTRTQSEYELDINIKLKNAEKYHLKSSHLKLLKEDCLILHPMPRCQEIDRAIDLDPRAFYWRQERNGMWTRVALISKILGVDDRILLPDLPSY